MTEKKCVVFWRWYHPVILPLVVLVGALLAQPIAVYASISVEPTPPTVTTLVSGYTPVTTYRLDEPTGLAPDLLAPVRREPKLDALLANIVSTSETAPEKVAAQVSNYNLTTNEGRIQVEIIIADHALVDVQTVIIANGGEVTGISLDQTLLQAWLPVMSLATVADHTDVQMIRTPNRLFPFTTEAPMLQSSEGLAVMNAPAWHRAGLYGAAVKVAIIDVGFQGYLDLLGSELPATVTVNNFVDGESDAQINGTTVHGTACAELIYDVAPDATLYLVKVATLLDLQEAVTWLIEQEVQIISTSIGFYNISPGDGTGLLADEVSRARDAGILWVTAAGNERESHWGGLFQDADADDWHEFPDDEEINCFGDNVGCYAMNPGFLISIFLRWDNWSSPVDQDYDLLLVRWNGNGWQLIGDGGQNFQNGGPGQQPTEMVVAQTVGPPTAYGIVIRRFAATRADVNFEIFTPNLPTLRHHEYARSLPNLADAPDIVTVAAVDVELPYQHQAYSAEGPTNGPGGLGSGGFMKPDLAAYTNISTQSYANRAEKFGGTSAAAPHVAGAAALVAGAFSDFTPDEIQSFLEERAIQDDTAFSNTQVGWGRLSLGAPPALPMLSINDIAVTEGDSGTAAAQFTVTLSAVSSDTVTVTYTTADDSAIAGSDYTTATGRLQFLPGTTEQSLVVPIIGDTVSEPVENFQVLLSTPINAELADAEGTGTVEDNDQPQQLLIVNKTGAGRGQITSVPTGITCGGECESSFAEGSEVILSAEPESGSTFGGWSGDCSDNDPCEITMNAAKEVTATFNIGPQWTLSVNKVGAGNGLITSEPVGIDCGTICTASFGDGTQVTLSALSDHSSRFIGWSGDCSGTLRCVVTLTSDMVVTATFTANIFLPIIMNHWPPLPSTPTLNAISNADNDGSYVVSWNQAFHGDTYDLQEDDNPAFSSPTIQYSGAETNWSASGKGYGTYYYRVQAKNHWNVGPWSNIEGTTVLPPTTIYSAEDATVLENLPTDNFGETVDMWAGYDSDGCHQGIPGAHRVRSLLKFDLGSIPMDVSITQVTLHISLVNACWRAQTNGGTRPVTAYRSAAPWSETAVTWNTQPAAAEAYGSAIIPLDRNVLNSYTLDVTELVRTWINGTAHNNGLLLMSPENAGDSAARFGIATREWRGVDMDPYLEIHYAVAAVAATADEPIPPTIAGDCWLTDGNIRVCSTANKDVGSTAQLIDNIARSD